MEKPLLTSAMEDYLKSIFELGEHDVKTQALADALKVNPASVTGMLKKLAGLKLVLYEKYQGVGLTPAGRLMALETIRHHRLIETYLSQALGYAWHEVHEEAEKLEHHISEDFEDRIAEALGHPAYDPHGDPIPGRDGTVPDTPGVPLVNLAPGQRVRLTRITRQEREVLLYLSKQQLVPGMVVRLLEQGPFNGPVTLEAAAGRVSLAHDLAREIHGLVLEQD